MTREYRRENMTGQQFGQWTVVLDRVDGWPKHVRVRCACGEFALVLRSELKRPDGTRSCISCAAKSREARRPTPRQRGKFVHGGV